MHTSLDQALGRQPRLNRVGQSILNIGGDASAAYSLRSLTGGEPKAVRIRRDGDNEERDFTTAEIVNEAAAWTNGLQETTLPADVATSAAAYSLRKVKSDYTGPAVRIRRKSDDVEVNVSFDTNDEVSTSSTIENTTEQGGESGSTAATTLGAFLTEEVTGYSSNFTTTDGWSGSSTTVTANVDANADGAGVPPSNDFLKLVANDRLSLRNNSVVNNFAKGSGSGDIEVTFDYYAPQDISTFKVIAFTSDGNPTAGANNQIVTGSGTFSATVTLTASQASGLTDFRVGSTDDQAGKTLYIKNLQIKSSSHNAAVHTWYDQSGSSNNATQTTDANQPLIAEGGAYLGELSFDGSNHTLSVATVSTLGIEGSNNKSAFAVARTTAGTDGFVIAGVIGGSSFRGLRYRSNATNGLARVEISSFGVEGGDLSDGNNHVYSSIFDGTQTQHFDVSLDGSITQGSGTDVVNTDGTITFSVGTITSNSDAGFTREFILYASDQTANRFKIESNINNHYGVYTAAQNGFVEKWYDQSGGTVEDLEQTTDSKQPSLVTSGSLNTRNGRPIIKFIQANSTFLQNSDLSMFPSGSDFALTVFHAMHIDSSSGGRIGVFGCNNGGNNPPTNGHRFGSSTSRRIAAKFKDASDSTTELTAGAYTDNSDSILTYKVTLNDGTASLSAFNNGSLLQESTASVTDQSYSIPSDKAILGARGTADNFSDSEFFEVIAFATDKSSERDAIEQSLSNYYGISLS